MRHQPAPVVNILPGEQQEVLLEHALDVGFAESACRWCRDVRDRPRWRADTEPSSRASRPDSRGRCLPDRTARAVRRSRRAPETSCGRTRRSRRRRRSRDRARWISGSMRCRTRRPPCCHQPSVRPVSSRSLFGIGKEDLAGDGEHLVVGEAVQQRLRENPRSTRMSLLSSTTMSLLRGAEAGVGAAAETQIAFERQHADLREVFAHEFRAAVLGAVVDDDDFAVRDDRPARRSRRADIFRADRGHSSWE